MSAQAITLASPAATTAAPDARLVESYLAGVSAGSRRAIRGSLAAIARVASEGRCERPDSIPWASLRPEAVGALKEALRAHYAPASVNRHLSALRGLVTHLYVAGAISADRRERLLLAAKGVKAERLPAGRERTGAELHALAATASSSPGLTGKRDLALLALLAGSGIRREEASGLRLGDVRVAEDMTVLTIRAGKGDKDREVSVSGRCHDAVQALVAELRWRGWGDDAPLLPRINRGGTPEPSPMTGSAIWKRVRELARRAGIATLSPHDFRRTATSGLLRRGVDLAQAQTLMGHSSPETTARYDRRAIEEAFHAARAWDPLAL
jgi:site-specific recombinase XerD